MLRLNSDWNDRGTDVVAVRMIEQQGKALAVMADLIDSFLTISEPEVPLVVGTAPRKHHVLLIDEDRGVLGVLRIYLLCAGYRVFAAASADEALRLPRIRTSLIDIIIADLDPDDEGFAVIEKARLLLGYDVPAVLLANQASIEIRRPEPIADVSLLRKPVNIDELNTLIGKALKRPRRSRLAQLRATGGKLRHDEPSPELVR